MAPTAPAIRQLVGFELCATPESADTFLQGIIAIAREVATPLRTYSQEKTTLDRLSGLHACVAVSCAKDA